MKRNSKYLPHFLKISMNILIILGTIVFIWAGVKSMLKLNGSISPVIAATFCLFITGGISLLAILVYLRKAVDSLIKRTPFIWENVKCMKRISICSFIISICYLLNIFINNQHIGLKIVEIDKTGVHTDIEFLIFFFAGCFIFILSEVFKQAVEYKEENDLTI